MKTIDKAEELIKKLAIIDSDIRREAMNQPTLFIEAARYRVDKMQERARIGAELESTRASLAVNIRNKKNAQGEKITEGGLKERLEKHSAIKTLRDRSDRAYEDEEFAKLLLEAYRQRRDGIRIIADMESYEGFKEGAEVERMDQRRKLTGTARKLQSRRRQI